MLGSFFHLLDRFCAVVFALLFFQIPQFFLVYTHRLGGHVSELKKQMDAMQKIAAKSGKGVGEFINKFKDHSDLDISLQGSNMHDMYVRYVDLSKAYISLEDSSPFTRPFIFLKSFDPEIFQESISHFTPGFPFSMEGIIYGLMGVTLSFLLFRALSFIHHRGWRSRIS